MMSELEALLAGIVSEPLEETRWLVLADWLEENDDPRRGELLRLHRKLLATCCEPEAHPERQAWQARVVELIGAGVKPCVPQRVVQLPGGVPMAFSFIPPGSFLMGGTVNDNERPVHKVTLTKGFFIGVHAVTQAQWDAVMGINTSSFKGPNRPVEEISWNDCQEFCKKMTTDLKRRVTVRLPTEAEWERACRSGTTTEYHFSDVLNTDLANYNGDSSWNDLPKGKNRQETTDVGSFPSNAWGLCDVHGNVWEWCSDGYGEYSPGNQSDPQGQSDGQSRVLRGGAWDNDPVLCRAAFRVTVEPAYRSGRTGFRICFCLE
ncbi:MAG: SUMF1/EgtB/PvdO family nonheme iron enzyme [Planctomycetes bacterium]|nr:SUMF1/EgtB/PvdO family nonheme iron enzyme [Planctomycetota bacterium]